MLPVSVCFFLAIVSCTQLDYAYSADPQSQESKVRSRGFLFFGKNSLDTGNLVYAFCDRIAANKTICTVMQKVYPDKNMKRSCNVTLESDSDESELNMGKAVATLGKDKAILFWSEDYQNSSSTTKVGTVDLETCTIKVVEMSDPKRHILMELYNSDKMVTYNDNSFDIFIDDPKRFGDKLGKVQINNDGTTQGEPSASKIRGGLVWYLAPIATGSSSKGYAVLRKDGEIFHLVLVKSDGTEKQLEKFTSALGLAYSAGENFLSACNKADADHDATCKQYDEDGKVKFSTIISVKATSTEAKAIKNLPGGGMLVLLAERKSCEADQSSCNRMSNYRMVNIAADGKIVGAASVQQLDSLSPRQKTHSYYIYKFGASEYCASIIGHDPTADELQLDDYDLVHQCVTEDEFSV